MESYEPAQRQEPRTVLITGAGSAIGIGRATASAFAEQGSRLALNDVVERDLAETVDLIRSMGGEAEGFVADVSDPRAVDRMVADAQSRFGPIEVLVNNAGIARKRAFPDMSDEEWQETLSVNLGGTMHCCRAVAPVMIARGVGRIVNVSSLMGSSWGWAQHVHYNASKAGIEGLTRGLALELGPAGITVNAVAPGFIETAQSLSVEHSAGPEKMQMAAPLITLRRIGQPSDIAGVIVFLASDASRYVTGQVLLVDGGLTLGDLRHIYGEAT